jgi:hypothetical protein
MLNRLEYRLKPLGDFVNVRGKLVQLYGCSFIDLEEFVSRVDKIRQLVQNAPLSIDGEQLGFDSLMSDSVFAGNVERCLELHGLALADVSLRHIQDLLLYEVVLDAEGQPELQPGLLIRINTPRTAKEAADETTRQLGGNPEQDSYERALAVIATHTKSVAEAIALTRQMSTAQLSEYLEQSSEIQKEIAKASAGSEGSSLVADDRTQLMQQLDKYCD